MNLELKGIGFNGKIIPSSRYSQEPGHQPVNHPLGLLESCDPILQKYSIFDTYPQSAGSRGGIEETGTGMEAVHLLPGECLVLNLGCSHATTYAIPKKDIRLDIRNTHSSDSAAVKGGAATTQTNAKTSATISIFGISYFKVRKIAAEIALYKEPEVYSGKGINYEGQKCFLKKKKRTKESS